MNMVNALCEVCQAKKANHWSGIICTDCVVWLIDNDTELIPIWNTRHPYHGAFIDSWLKEIRRRYRGEVQAETQGDSSQAETQGNCPAA